MGVKGQTLVINVTQQEKKSQISILLTKDRVC